MQPEGCRRKAVRLRCYCRELEGERMSDEGNESSSDRADALSTLAEVSGGYSDDDWDKATERVEATRQHVRATNPAAAEAEAKAYAAISARVQTLRALRRARGYTQSEISSQLEISQAEVSRMERRSNLQLNTLARFIEAIGGRLCITAIFDDQEVEIGVGDLLASFPESN